MHTLTVHPQVSRKRFIIKKKIYNNFCPLVQVPASVFTMLAITLERRRAVMTPLTSRTNRVTVSEIDYDDDR